MNKKLLSGAAFAALMIPGAALAQSTGTLDAENRDVVVTGSRAPNTGGFQTPDTPKAREVLTQEYIAHQTPGQSINDIINLLPGVSFQNNDPFGSAGGTLTIRGFDSSRISQTFDGIPLNDTGNYAIYSNQQLDPELIQQVNVNLGTTDVDSPTASATGSTVNYRSIDPTEQFGARLVGSVGDFNFFRVFGLVNTGNLTSFGTRAWFAASSATNNVVFNDFGKVDKQQYNAKVYQPIGSNGDFISVSGHYNQNRNNFFGSAPLRIDSNVFTSTAGTAANGFVPTLVTGAIRPVGTATASRFPTTRDESYYHVARCQVVQGVAGTAQATNTCGTSYDERYNPSNTANIRFNSRFTLTDGLVLTVDPYYQYTKANGGGTVTGVEGTGYTQTATATRSAITTPLYGFINNVYYAGQDLNGDGDRLDSVTLLAPSQTVTNRYGVIASLRYDFSPEHSIRIGYTHDYGRHRQTGEVGFLQQNGVPVDVFPINNGIRSASGYLLEKRDRLSFAVLDEADGEYRGNFFDKRLTVTAGIRAPFLKRNLTNYCFATSATGGLNCFGRGDTADNATFAAANPYSTVTAANGAITVTGFAAPQYRQFTYNRVLPQAGFTFKINSPASIYFNYSKGLQVPGTDNLYNAFYFPVNSAAANTTPETTNNFDAGVRYTTSRVQVQVGPWYTRFSNRLASSFDPDLQASIYRNLGRVDKYGVDGSIAYRPVKPLLLYVFGSYLHSEIKNNVLLGYCANTLTSNCTAVGNPIYALTAGKRESGAPVYTAGGRAQLDIAGFSLGAQVKRTGRRYVNDQNLPLLQCTVATVNQVCPTVNNTAAAATPTRGIEYQVYGAATGGYTQVDFDARVPLTWAGLNEKTYLQFNLENAFNEYYVGGVGGGTTTQYTVPFAQLGSPRAVIATLNVAI